MADENEKFSKDPIHSVAKVPIDAVKTTVEMEKDGAKVIGQAILYPLHKRRSILDFFWRSKRGVITGAADNDPAGIVTYTQTGAIAGFKLLWMCVLAWPLLIAVEEMSARIGVVAKKGINQVIKENYGKSWAYLAASIVLVCNTFTIGADIAAMADIAHVLTGLASFIFVIILGGLFFYLLWKSGYRNVSRYLFLITPIFLLYVVSALLLDVPWGQALRDTFIPPLRSFNSSLIFIAVAFLGTTLSPYLIYWETTQQIEEKRSVSEIKNETRGTATGMFFSQFITYFIVVAAAAAFAGGYHEFSSAKEAALALKPLGNLSFLFFSIGILGAGLLAIPVLSASTGYTISETFGWKKGLDKSFSEAKGFYLVMSLSLIIGLAIASFGFNPILALIYSQVLNGILMPVLILLLLLITNNKKIMGEYTNKIFTNFFGILALLITLGFDTMMLIDWLRKF